MINYAQLYAAVPYASLLGTEIIAVQGAGGTGGTTATILKGFVKAGFVVDDVTDAGTFGKTVVRAASLAAAKTLLEIPALPLAPATIAANTTLGTAQINRRTFITAAATLTLAAGSITTTDSFTLVNVSGGAITINPGAGESFIIKGTGTGATYSIPNNDMVRVYLVNSTTWFIEN